MEQLKEHYREILKHGYDCPDCDNSGVIAVQTGPDEWEPAQCEWCYTYPGSKFRLKQLLDSFIETAMRDAYNEARNQTPYIDFDDYFSQIKETLINNE